MSTAQSREILSLVIGNEASYVGSHFWNSQSTSLTSDDINHDVLYRSGRNLTGEETYTPRVIFVDLKGSFGSMKTHSELYEGPANDDILWDGQSQQVRQEPRRKNEYLKSLESDTTNSTRSFADHLKETTESWTDFNYSYFHPRSIVELSSYTHNSSTAPFDSFEQGVDTFNELNMYDEMIDSRIRSYLEECNSPQGFQILCSVSNGFAGFGSSVVTALQDEYPKKAKLIFGITPPTQVIKAQMNENMALVMESFTDSGAFYVPLRPPSLSDFASERALSKYLRPMSTTYEWSGYLAAAIDTATLPTRLIQSSSDFLSLEYMTSILTRQNGAHLGGLIFGLPLPLERSPSPDMFGTKSWGTLPFLRDLTLNVQSDVMDMFGFPHASLATCRLSVQRSSPDPSVQSCRETMESLWNNWRIPTTQRAFLTKTPLLLSNTFPRLFDEKLINSYGNTRSTDEKETSDVHQVGAYTRLHTSSQLHTLISAAKQTLMTFLKTHTRFDVEQYEERVQKLEELYDRYNCNEF